MRFLENMLLKTVPFLEHPPILHSEFQEYSLCIMLITDSEKSEAWRVRVRAGTFASAWSSFRTSFPYKPVWFIRIIMEMI